VPTLFGHGTTTATTTTAAAAAAAATADGDIDEDIELAFDSDLHKLLSKLEDEEVDDHDDAGYMNDMEVLTGQTVSSNHQPRNRIDSAVSSGVNTSEQVATVEVVSGDEEVYLQRLKGGVRIRILGESSTSNTSNINNNRSSSSSSTERLGRSNSNSNSSEVSAVEVALTLEPYEDPHCPIDTPDATVVASCIKVNIS